MNVLLGGSIGGQCKVRRNKKLYDFLFQTICDKVRFNYVIPYDVICRVISENFRFLAIENGKFKKKDRQFRI